MIIVTGGAGLIGSYIIEELNSRGYSDILLVDHFGVSEKYKNMHLLQISDCLDRDDLWDYLSNLQQKKSSGFSPIQAVFHLGACSSTTETNTHYLLKNNFEYSKKLFEFCNQNAIPLIYASSASVYGMGQNGFSEHPECEEPLNGYAWSKLLFDNWLRKQQNIQKSRTIGLRYFNVFGPKEHHKGRMASVIWQFSKQIEHEQKLKLFEGSEQFLRDFVWVKDAARTTVNLWEKTTFSGIVNIGTGHTHSFLEVAEQVSAYFNNNPIEWIPFPADLVGKYQKFTKSNDNLLRAIYEEHNLTLEWTPLHLAIQEYLSSRF